MRLECPNCSHAMDIPEEKLPDADRFRVRCPSCGDEFPVDRKRSASDSVQDVLNAEVRWNVFAAGEIIEPDSFPPGARVAFLYLPKSGWAEAARKTLESRGYYLTATEDEREAVLKVRFNDYSLLLVRDCPEAENVLREIGSLRGSRRRSANVLMIGEEARSLSPNIAFLRSVNAYLHEADHSRAGELIDRCVADYESRYEPLRIVLEERWTD